MSDPAMHALFPGWKNIKTSASSIVITQLAFWVRTKRGMQRIALQKWLTDLIEAMHGRILGFNVSTAYVWAE